MNNRFIRSRTIMSLCWPALSFLILTACGDGAGNGRDAAAGGGGDSYGDNPYYSTADLCGLVPVSEIAAALGGVEPFSSEPAAYPPASCTYRFELPDSSAVQTASVTVQMLGGFDLERQRAGEAAVDIESLGEEAWAHPRTDSYLLYVGRGDLVFSVSVEGGSAENWPAMARSAAEVALSNL